jgi:hypothetical protein
MIALVAMTADHVALFLFEAPLVSSLESYLHIFGRIAAPIFLFMVAEGARYTHSRGKYILRLYIGNIVCMLLQQFCQVAFRSYIGLQNVGNIFPTMMYTVIIIHCVEQSIRFWRERKHLRSFLEVAVLCAVCIIPTMLSSLFLNNHAVLTFGKITPGSSLGIQLVRAFIPSILTVEYTPIFIVLGLLFYWLPNKTSKAVSLVAFALLARYSMGIDMGFLVTYFGIYQFYMILALPFICLYNGKKGRGDKYFFYVYYIIHPYILLAIGYLCGMRFMGG